MGRPARFFAPTAGPRLIADTSAPKVAATSNAPAPRSRRAAEFGRGVSAARMVAVAGEEEGLAGACETKGA